MEFYTIAGNHPLILAYNEKCKETLELSRAVTEARRAAPLPEARYRVKTCTLDRFAPVETYRFLFELVNEDEKKAYCEVWGGIGGFWENTRASVGVYCKNNILLRSGGGHLIFNEDAPLVSEEEWTSLKNGIIPSRIRACWIVD